MQMQHGICVVKEGMVSVFAHTIFDMYKCKSSTKQSKSHIQKHI